jgi:quercetin dioxygenase-like cupin family protein
MKDQHQGSVIPDNHLTGSFTDLVDMQPGAVVSRTLLKGEGGNLTIFAFDEGEGLSSHTTPHDAVIWVIEGKVGIKLQDQNFDLVEGDYFLLPADIPHAVFALSQMKMALLLFFRSDR